MSPAPRVVIVAVWPLVDFVEVPRALLHVRLVKAQPVAGGLFSVTLREPPATPAARLLKVWDPEPLVVVMLKGLVMPVPVPVKPKVAFPPTAVFWMTIMPTGMIPLV